MIEYAYINNGTVTSPVLANSIEDIPALLVSKVVKGVAPIMKQVEKQAEDGSYYLDTIFEDGEVDVTVYEEAPEYKVRVLDYDTGTFSVLDGAQFNKGTQASVEEQVRSLTHITPVNAEDLEEPS